MRAEDNSISLTDAGYHFRRRLPFLRFWADVMKRIAAPMIGGVITSGVLELLLYPVIYVLWRKRHLPQHIGASH
jgi:hypothetical protein